MKKLDEVFINIESSLNKIPGKSYRYHNNDRWLKIRAETDNLFDMYSSLVDWHEKMNAVQRFLSYRSTQEKIKAIQYKAAKISRQIAIAQLGDNEARLSGEMTGYESNIFQAESLQRKLRMQTLATQLKDLAMEEEKAQDDIEQKRNEAQLAREITMRRFGELFPTSPPNQSAARKEEIVREFLKEQEDKITKVSETLYVPPRDSGGGDLVTSPVDITIDADEQSADEDPTTPTTLASFATAQD
ncbi:hypothetical protein EWM64_g577 [Hericium alpestre]|uniref:Uncharacterized protein n=1 Tax=Hericium alpestre TaxID=135208 RepID=A0A4Z0A8M9_9AGAM|nr:hypothetical protein EWM64_g577 [Hericium alpestre]